MFDLSGSVYLAFVWCNQENGHFLFLLSTVLNAEYSTAAWTCEEQRIFRIKDLHTCWHAHIEASRNGLQLWQILFLFEPSMHSAVWCHHIFKLRQTCIWNAKVACNYFGFEVLRKLNHELMTDYLCYWCRIWKE